MKTENGSLDCAQDIEKDVGEYKDIEKDFYSNDYTNNDNDLESRI
jgi:hypothetical protein